MLHFLKCKVFTLRFKKRKALHFKNFHGHELLLTGMLDIGDLRSF